MLERRSTSRFRPVAAAGSRQRLDLGVPVRQQELLPRLLLGAVAVEVDGVQDALGQVVFRGRRQLRDQEVEEDRALLPAGVGVRQHGRQKGVAADEALGGALERDLPVFVQVTPVDRGALVQDRIEAVALGAAQQAPRELLDLLLGIDLGAVQAGLQVVQPVGVGFVGQDGGR